MDNVIKIYEIQNKGKGILTELLPEDLLSLKQEIDGSETIVMAGTNVTVTGAGTTLSPYVVNSATPSGSETKVTAGTNVTVSGSGTTASPYIINSTTTVDGSETKVTAGTNTTVTGSGTTASPYVVNSTATADGSETKVTAGTNVTVSGSGTTASPYVVNSTTPDGSETKLSSGTTTTVSGSGTTASPYTVEVVTSSSQQSITYPTDFSSLNYTLTASNNNKLIFVNNGTTAVTITIPTGLTSEFFASFIQKGSGTVTFVASGTTLQTPVGLIIKGIYYQATVDKVGTTEVFNITGNTTA